MDRTYCDGCDRFVGGGIGHHDDSCSDSGEFRTLMRYETKKFHEDSHVELPDGAVGVTLERFGDWVYVSYLVPEEGEEDGVMRPNIITDDVKEAVRNAVSAYDFDPYDQ